MAEKVRGPETRRMSSVEGARLRHHARAGVAPRVAERSNQIKKMNLEAGEAQRVFAREPVARDDAKAVNYEKNIEHGRASARWTRCRRWHELKLETCEARPRHPRSRRDSMRMR